MLIDFIYITYNCFALFQRKIHSTSFPIIYEENLLLRFGRAFCTGSLKYMYMTHVSQMYNCFKGFSRDVEKYLNRGHYLFI
jgi:hypothetical protein